MSDDFLTQMTTQTNVPTRGVDKLEELGLPVFINSFDIISALGITENDFLRYSLHYTKSRVPNYNTFEIAKRSGGKRLISAPNKNLKRIQRKLNSILFSLLPVSDAAHGFRAAHSIRTNACPHVGKKIVIKLDITDCFSTITFPRVNGLLQSVGYSPAVSVPLANIVTESHYNPTLIDGQRWYLREGPRRCVQGAPTSPAICNAILRILDARLKGVARYYGFNYTRYADDLTFSGDIDDKVGSLMAVAVKIIQKEGFAVNDLKTRVLRNSNNQSIAGVTVNSVVGKSRKYRRLIRARIDWHRKGKRSGVRSLREIAGHLSFIKMLNADQAEVLQKKFRNLDGSHKLVMWKAGGRKTKGRWSL